MRYDKRGVSADKKEVHQAIAHLDKGLFPHAFCKILPDIVANDPTHVNIMHADTAGTKTSLAYLYWKETGDMSVWQGIIQDALVMNLDDMACVGCVQDIILSSTIGRNKHLIPGEVVAALISGTSTFIDSMKSLGITLHLAGGETADVGDIVRTLDVGFTAFARMPKEKVIEADITEGDYIVGFASYGKSTYEQKYNSGMGSNGLTSARHDVFNKTYASKYPESYDPNTPEEVVYMGSKSLQDTLMIDGDLYTVGQLVLSPTRTYLPLIHQILLSVCKADIHGLIHCTGGAQTKVMKFLKRPVHIVKDNLLPIPPLFKIIQNQSGVDLKEMYQVFNMGHRLEAYTPSEAAAHHMVNIAKAMDIDAQIIGRVKPADQSFLTIVAEGEQLKYL